MRRTRDRDGWPLVSDSETWAEAVAALLVFLLLVAALFAVVFTLGSPVR